MWQGHALTLLVQLCRRRGRVHLCDIITWCVMNSTVHTSDDECQASASGLLWLSELIEEHSRLAKTLGERSIYVSISHSGSCCKNRLKDALDHHRTALSSVLDGLLPFEAHRVLRCLPGGLPAELHSQLANDLLIFAQLRLVLRHGYCEPFHVVLLLLAPH